MDYEAKVRKLDKHLSEHPKDYQSVIALLKANSDRIADKRRKKAIEKVRQVAEIRRERRAKHEKSEQQ